MSLERAEVSCRKCYSLHKKNADDERCYNTQIGTMKSLEEERHNASIPLTLIILDKLNNKKDSLDRTLIEEYLEEKSSIAKNCLRMCGECDYQTPRISEYISRHKNRVSQA